MDVRLHARNTSLDDGFRALATDKVEHAGRVFDLVSAVDVELIEESNPRRAEDRYRLEMTSTVNGRVIRIVTAAATPDTALDDAVERFTRRVRRLKERMIDSHRRPVTLSGQGFGEGSDDESDIVRVKQFVMKPMTIEEATLQMELLGHDFFFFTNAATDKNSVLYRRRDGRLGLIEPA